MILNMLLLAWGKVLKGIGSFLGKNCEKLIKAYESEQSLQSEGQNADTF